MTWPVVLVHEDLMLRPLRRRDQNAWLRLRKANETWLRQWEASSPRPNAGPPPTFGSFVREANSQARAGLMLPFAIDVDGELVGQLTVSSIARGSLCSASIGYWISEHMAGRGIVPTAVAMATDHCWHELGLHRIEVNVRPENVASLRVVEKLGFRDEGVRRRYLHIDGDWRDHRTFALTAEEAPGGLLRRWTDVGGGFR